VRLYVATRSGYSPVLPRVNLSVATLLSRSVAMRFLTKKQVKDLTTLSFAEIARREANGRFPRRRRLSEHPRGRVVYIEAEIIDWMESCPADG
jgi:predicted DNA-binding transcriptional regulator AlpA